MSATIRTSTASVLFEFIEIYFPKELSAVHAANCSFSSSKPLNRATTTSDALDLLIECLRKASVPLSSSPQEVLEGSGCVPLENMVLLLCQLINNNDKFDEAADSCIIIRLGELMPFVRPTSEGFAVLSNSLRRANRTGDSLAPVAQSELGGTVTAHPPSRTFSTVQAKLWISVLNYIATAVDNPMQSSSPHYIKFNGDRDSYLQLTCHSIPCPLAYTVTMWICVDEGGEVHSRSTSAASSGHNTPQGGLAGARGFDRSPALDLTPGFPPKRGPTGVIGGTAAAAAATITLFKCRSPIGGIEALLTECPPTPGSSSHSRGSSWADSMQSPSAADCDSPDPAFSGAAATPTATVVTKQYSVAIRTIVENSQGSVDGHETVGRVCLTTNCWQLLALTHTCNEEDHMNSALSFTVNGSGVTAVEADLPYPFTNNPSESQWFFCTGLRGRLSSVCLYAEAACNKALTMLYEATAAVHSFDAAFAVASTWGSGSTTGGANLGSIWMKGEYASLIANKYKPVFCITAGHFMSAPPVAMKDPPANLSSLTPILPYSPTGISRVDCSVMKPLSQSVSTVGTKVHLAGDGAGAAHPSNLPPGSYEPATSSYASSTGASHLIPSLSGSCVIHRNTQNWNNTLLSSGGCIPLFYMLFHYCRSHPATADSDASSTACTAHSACISATLNLLAHFVKSSVDAREQFLLLHGFHVVAMCLHTLPRKEISVTQPIVERCFSIVRALGLDATQGDGVAAALQGLLFNFQQVWGSTSLAIKELVLTNLVSLLLANNSITFSGVEGASGISGSSGVGKTITSGDHLYKYIGLQRILDILKLYLLPTGSSDSACNSTVGSPAQPQTPSSPTLLSVNPAIDTPGFGPGSTGAEATLTRATDMCVCLLSMTLEASFKAHPANAVAVHRRESSPYCEVELLLIALEGADDGALMERLLRVLYNLRLTCPALLKQVLYDNHYAETTALVILTRNDISFCSRRLCLLLVIWAIGEDLVTSAAEVSPLRRSMAADTGALLKSGALGSPVGASSGVVFRDEMHAPQATPNAGVADGAGADEAGRLNTQQKILRANRRLSTSIKGGIKVLRRQSVATAQRFKGTRDRGSSSHPNGGDSGDEYVPDRAKWEQLSACMRRVEKAWRVVSSIRDVIAQKLPPNDVAELLGFFNKSLVADGTDGAGACAPQSVSLARKFYSLNLGPSSPNQSRSPRRNQGDKWVLDDNSARISYMPSVPSSASNSPMVSPMGGGSGGFGGSAGKISAPTLRRTSSGYSRSTELEVKCPMDEILDIFAHDGPLMGHHGPGGIGNGDDHLDGQAQGASSQLHVWLVLPLLPLFLSYTSLHNIQRTLMSLSVTMKTDDSEALITSILADSKAWVACFIQLAVLGADKKRQVIKAAYGMKGESTTAALPANHPYGGYTRRGSGEEIDTELEIAETCIELALDCLALVMEKKMTFVNSPFYQSYHSISSITSESDYELVDAAPQMTYSSSQSGPVGNSWGVWKTVLKTATKLAGSIPAEIYVSPAPAVGPAVDGGVVKYPSGSKVAADSAPRFLLTDSVETLDQRLTKRSFALTFQRLARTGDPWAEGSQIFSCISELLLFVETHELCYRSCLTVEGDIRTTSLAIDGSSSYDSPGDVPVRVAMNTDERHLLCFLIDLCANIRRHANKGALGGREWGCVLIGMRVVVSCLGFCTDDIADRCAHELYLLLIYFCKPWGAGSSDVLKNYLLLVFDELHKLMVGNSAWSGSGNAKAAAEASTADDLISPHAFGRYSALMFSFMHHFSDLRDSSMTISPHVEPILDALLGVDTCNQVELLFQLVQVSLRASDIVSASPSVSQAHSGSHSRMQSRALGGDAVESADDGLLIDLDGYSDNSSEGEGGDGTEEGVARLIPGGALAMVDTSAVNFKPGTMQRDITSNAVDDYYNPKGGSAAAGAGTFAEEPAAVVMPEPDLLGVIEFTSPSPPPAAARPLPKPPTPPAIAPFTPAPANRQLSRSNSELRRQKRDREAELQYGIDRERSQQHWLESSHRVLLERKDAELVRLSRTVQFHESGAVATQRMWSKLYSKYESEYLVSLAVLGRCRTGGGKRLLLDGVDPCPSVSYEWKLGISHESNYPGRERKVVRRVHLDQSTIEEARRVDRERAEERQRNEDENRVAMEAFQRKTLAEAEAAQSKAEIARGDAASPAKLPLPLSDLEDVFAQAPVVGLDSSAIAQASVPGGWGIIDVDSTGDDVTISESESVAGSTSSDAATEDTAPITERSGGDVDADVEIVDARASEGSDAGSVEAADSVSEAARVIEESEKQHDRVLDTGPVDEGMRAFSSAASRQRGAHIKEASIILVTAGGSYTGKIAFNNKEVWVVTTCASIESIDQAEKRSKKQRSEEKASEEGPATGGLSINTSDGAGRVDAGSVSAAGGTLGSGPGFSAKVQRRRWPMAGIAFIFLRRYRLRDSALEVLFQQGSQHKSFFVDFGHTKENMRTRNEFTKALMAAAPPSAYKQSFVPAAVFRMAGSSDLNITQRWVDGEMSNYDYLMSLNTLAGRTYNDLCQYPVMPWILSQYTESHINLRHKRNYRDLSKPMGAQNEARLNDYIERYESFADNNVLQEVPPFMYGSHYSTMVGVVLHYLVRLQPFASLHKEMQTGHFDVPDRLFSSIPRCYHHNTTMLSEVKELTPEWFTMPDFLKNVNGYRFGTSQEGEVVDDVILPPWCASAEEFIAINRQALESDYVSMHLHQWIDLIFGFKQTGQAAIDAHNVFYYLTYYGAVNRDAISESMRRAIELQIAHFGSHPMQLFKRPHPAKKLRVQRPAPRSFQFCFPVQQIFYGPQHNRSVGGASAVNVSMDPTAAVLTSPTGASRVIDNPKDHGRPSLGIATYPSTDSIPTSSTIIKQEKAISSVLIPNNTVFSSVFKVGSLIVDNVSMNTSTSGYSRWGVQNIDSLEEFLSVDSSATLVTRRRTVCRILRVTVLSDQIVCVLDNGIVEVYRYGMSPGAKASITHIQNAMQQQHQASGGRGASRHGHARGRTSVGAESHGVGSASYPILGADPVDPYSADSSADAAICNLLYRRSHFVHAYRAQSRPSGGSAAPTPQKQNRRTGHAADSISEMERQHYAKEESAAGAKGKGNAGAGATKAAAVEAEEHNLMDMISFDDGFITTAVEPPVARNDDSDTSKYARAGRGVKHTGKLLTLDKRPMPLSMCDAGAGGTGVSSESSGSLLDMDSEPAAAVMGSEAAPIRGEAAHLDDGEYMDSSSEEEEEEEHAREANDPGGERGHPSSQLEQNRSNDLSPQEQEEEREKRAAIAAVQALLEREKSADGAASASSSTGTPARVSKGPLSAVGTPAGAKEKEKSIPPMVCNGDIVVAVERDSSHFEQPPRIPLSYIISNTSSYSNYLPQATAQHVAQNSSYVNQMTVYRTLLNNFVALAKTVHVDDVNNKQMYSFGYCDGRVSIRTFDPRLGTVTLGAEYRVHKQPVICLATDVVSSCCDGVSSSTASTDISNTNADMLLGAAGVSAVPSSLTVVHASVDTQGLLTVWSMVRKCTAAPAGQANTNPNSTVKWLVAKRPLSVFKLVSTVNPHAVGADMNAHCCDISSSMNIVVGSSYLAGGADGSGADSIVISVLSLELKELIHMFVITVPDSGPGRYTQVGKLCLSSDAVIIVHLVTVDVTSRCSSSTICSYSLMGQLLGSTSITHTSCTPVYRANAGASSAGSASSEASTPHSAEPSDIVDPDATCVTSLSSLVTYMALPTHSRFLLTGHENGAVCIWNALNMTLLYTCSLHDTYQRYTPPAGPLSNMTPISTTAAGSAQPKVAPSPVLHVTLGPNPKAPILMTVTTLSGQMYVRPLPDFLTVERSKGILSLAQLVSAPLTQLTKTTSQVANWTSDTATVAAQNAKQMADEAYVELKKTANAFGKSNIVKNVGSFFGGWGGSSAPKS